MFDSKSFEMLNNVVDEKILQDNLSFTAFYIAVYENFAYIVQDRIKSFYCHRMTRKEDGTFEYEYDEEYVNLIKNRIVDDKGNKNPLKASVLWFVDAGAITMDDYELFLKIKEQRNVFVHQLTDVILRGNTEEEIVLFFQMFELYQKIEKWWINEIEIPCSGEFLPDSYNRDEVESVITGLYKLMIDVLFLGHSEKLKQFVNEQMRKHGGGSDETPI